MLLLTEGSFVEKILPIERNVFLWLNNNHTDFWDMFMFLYSHKFTWMPVTILLFCILIYKVKLREVVLFLICGLLLGFLCDFVAAEFIKPFFGRLRPTHHPDFKDFVEVVQQYRGGRFGFISNHASNGFGIALFTSFLFKYRYYTYAIYTWVLITAYSRIYLGVHFISDVVGGFIWGSLGALLIYGLYYWVRSKIFKLSDDQLKKPLLSHKKAQVIMLGLAITVLYIIARSAFA